MEICAITRNECIHDLLGCHFCYIGRSYGEKIQNEPRQVEAVVQKDCEPPSQEKHVSGGTRRISALIGAYLKNNRR